MRGYVTSRGRAGVTFGIGGLIAFAILAMMFAVFVGAAIVVAIVATIVVTLARVGITAYHRRHPAG